MVHVVFKGSNGFRLQRGAFDPTRHYINGFVQTMRQKGEKVHAVIGHEKPQLTLDEAMQILEKRGASKRSEAENAYVATVTDFGSNTRFVLRLNRYDPAAGSLKNVSDKLLQELEAQGGRLTLNRDFRHDIIIFAKRGGQIHVDRLSFDYIGHAEEGLNVKDAEKILAERRFFLDHANKPFFLLLHLLETHEAGKSGNKDLESLLDDCTSFHFETGNFKKAGITTAGEMTQIIDFLLRRFELIKGIAKMPNEEFETTFKLNSGLELEYWAGLPPNGQLNEILSVASRQARRDAPWLWSQNAKVVASF